MFHNEFSKLCKTLNGIYFRSQFCKPPTPITVPNRQLGFNFLLEWFNKVFNAVDRERLSLVGPDCACAEWILRNGASVRFKGHPDLLSDYNTLIALEESPEQKRLKIEEIYARGSELSDSGFDHLKNCDHVRKITFIFCARITDEAVKKLKYVANTLEHLELTSCFNVQDAGVKSLEQLRNLKVLKLGDLVSVKNPQDCENHLKSRLSECKIEFEYSSQV